MLARSATIFKWALYALAGLLWAAVQSALLRHLRLEGVIPFLYPLIAVLPATYEGPAPGTVYALCAGALWDLLLPSPIPCFYTLILPPAALCAALVSRSFLSAGYVCSAAAALATYTLTGAFHCAVLWATGHAAWGPGLRTAVLELGLSLPWCVPMTWLFRRVYLRVHADD